VEALKKYTFIMISKAPTCTWVKILKVMLDPPSVHQKACLVIESQFDWIISVQGKDLTGTIWHKRQDYHVIF
jgi:hypothetical protein